MNLADMLSYADIHQLSRIANNYDCECNGHSKNELIQSILTKINRRDIFENAIRNLSIEDIRFLNSLLFDRRECFSLEELVARVQQSKFVAGEKQDGKESMNPRDIISSFKHRGWLFNGYSQQTKYLFQFPKDLKRRFSDALAKHFSAKIAAVDSPSAYRDEQQIILDDMLHFLHYLHHHETPLTSEGVMYKRSLQQILEGLTVQEEPVGKSGWRFGYGRKFKEYPNRFSFIYDYCYFNKLIAEEGSVLTLTHAGETRVLERKKEDLMNVYTFWLRLYKGPIPNLPAIVQWIDKLTKRWVTFATLKPVLCELIRPYYYDHPESILEQRIIYMLMHLGIMRIGEAERLGTVVQVTPLGSKVIGGSYVADEDKIDISVDH